MILSNKYKITKIITQSTYSTLYEAEHIIKNSKVAIKIECDEICKKLLENEIQLYLYLKKGNLNTTDKLNIPQIKDIGAYDNYKYIVMELLDKNLKQRINENITKKDFIIIIKQLFILIKNFHRRNLLHRDIKPENFVFNKQGNLCIIDLGLSCFNDRREIKTFIGNKLYASHNCHLDYYIYTPSDDLKSIIYMLLHLYTDVLPWSDKPNTYEIKKYCNLNDFYKDKMDKIVELLLFIYNKIDGYYFYERIDSEINKLLY
jgi:serine/threonine protein kinase